MSAAPIENATRPLLDEALSCLAEVNWALKAYYMDLPTDRAPGPPKALTQKIDAVLKRADTEIRT